MKTPVVFFHDYASRRGRPLAVSRGARVVALPLPVPLTRKAQEKAAVQVAENEGMPPARG